MNKFNADVPFYSLFFCVLLLALVGYSTASDIDESISRIQKAYENIRDIKGTFIQKNTIKDLKKTAVYKGDFFIKPPMKMKWAYKDKSAQDIGINNSKVLIYRKGDRQAYKGTFDRETYGQAPVALLSGFGKISDEFYISGRGNILILKPRKSIGNVISVKLLLNDDVFPIKSFIIQDGRSNLIEVRLDNVAINTGLKDSVFELSLPEGVNIYELNP